MDFQAWSLKSSTVTKGDIVFCYIKKVHWFRFGNWELTSIIEVWPCYSWEQFKWIANFTFFIGELRMITVFTGSIDFIIYCFYFVFTNVYLSKPFVGSRLSSFPQVTAESVKAFHPILEKDRTRSEHLESPVHMSSQHCKLPTHFIKNKKQRIFVTHPHRVCVYHYSKLSDEQPAQAATIFSFSTGAAPIVESFRDRRQIDVFWTQK